MIRLLFLFLTLFTTTTIAQEIPKTTRYIMDTAAVLSQSELNNINNKLANIEKTVTDHPQVMALIVASTGEKDINEYANQVFDAWKPGSKDKSNGMVLIITKDGHIVIRTGYGTEGRITDSQTREITDAMKSSLQTGKWYQALSTYANMSQNLLLKTQEPATSKNYPHDKNYVIIVAILVIIFAFIFAVIYCLRRTGSSGDFVESFSANMIGSIVGSVIGSVLSDSSDSGSDNFTSGGGDTSGGGSSDEF